MANRYKKYKPPFLDRNRAGEKICVMCGKPLTGRKYKWCGDIRCVQRAFIRSGDQSAMRRYVLDRDKGICARCGLDLKTIQELDDILRGRTEIEKPPHVLNRVWHKTCESWGHRWSHQEWIDFLTLLDIDPGHHMHYWEADHIIPFSEGGPHHEDNLQILCLNCHHRKAIKKKLPDQFELF